MNRHVYLINYLWCIKATTVAVTFLRCLVSLPGLWKWRDDTTRNPYVTRYNEKLRKRTRCSKQSMFRYTVPRRFELRCSTTNE